MTDVFIGRAVVVGLIAVILTGLGLAAFAPQGGDVFSDAVKIALGALAGVVVNLSRRDQVEVVNPPDDPVNVAEPDELP